jgi:SWI/SNF-related matrix-associated actin-dependent regulator 1 of chromatin subfamily A
MGSSTLNLFAYQQEGVRFLLEHSGALLADDMGLGKTAQAIEVINRDLTIARVLIVCPASLKLPWKRELEKWLSRKDLAVAVIDGNWPMEATITILNYDRIYQHLKYLGQTNWDLIVFDECHYLKNPLARRTQIATRLVAIRRIALSGTPLQNRPVELLPILTWLDPLNWPLNRWHEFGLRYCGGFFNGIGWEYTGATNLEELQSRLRASVMLRRTKQEVLTDLPPKFRSVIELSVTTDLEGTIQAELAAFASWADSLPIGEADQDGNNYQKRIKDLRRFQGSKWDNLAVARHETALAKVPLVVAFIRELFATGSGKIVIFAHHRDVIALLAERLACFGPVTLTGADSSPARMKAIDRFQSDPETRLFIGNIQAAGVGITLAPASSHCVFAEASWVPAQMTQAEDRLHRIGTSGNVLVQHLVLEGSLDAVMIRRLIAKQEILNQVLDA